MKIMKSSDSSHFVPWQSRVVRILAGWNLRSYFAILSIVTRKIKWL